MGKIIAICISDKRGVQKNYIESAELIENHGIKGDAHAGDWHRQVSLISAQKIAEFNARGANVKDGAFGENIIADGIDFAKLPIGTKLKCQNALLEITQIGKECHSHCAIYHAVGDCIMPREGVFARVLKGGKITVGDEISIQDEKFKAVVITLSDRCASGQRKDLAGPLIAIRLEAMGFEIIGQAIIPDEKEQLEQMLINLTDTQKPDLILTTGSTGMALRDIAPEATLAIADRNAPGIAEAIRAHSMRVTNRAMLSRGASVIRKRTLIINLPGSPNACSQSIDCIQDVLAHAIGLLRGEKYDCAKLEK